MLLRIFAQSKKPGKEIFLNASWKDHTCEIAFSCASPDVASLFPADAPWASCAISPVSPTAASGLVRSLSLLESHFPVHRMMSHELHLLLLPGRALRDLSCDAYFCALVARDK